MTQPLPPLDGPPAPLPRLAAAGPARPARLVAVTIAALVLIGAGAGVGMAVTAGASDTGGSGMTGPGMTAPRTGQTHQGVPERQAWSHKYGVDRATMPDLAPTDAATPAQQAAAAELLARTESATAKYADPAAARADGYDLQASLARKQKSEPRFAARMKALDAGSTGQMPMLHVANRALRSDGKVLDPAAPETLMYAYRGGGDWMLVGVMYLANESYPQAPPDPGGPITRWHYHDRSGARGLMMHVFFNAGDDLAKAYAAEMT